MMMRIVLSLMLTLLPFRPFAGKEEAPEAPVITEAEGSPLMILASGGPVCSTTSMASGTTTFSTVTSGSVIAAAGSGLRNYVFSGQVSNTGNTNVLITWRDGAAGSALAYTTAPAGYGRSNPVYVVPFRTSANTAVYAQTDAASTTVQVSAQGCKLP